LEGRKQINYLLFTQDRKKVLSVSPDTVRIWNFDMPRLLNNCSLSQLVAVEDLIRRCTSENERCAVPAEKRRLYDNLHPEIRPILENKYPVGEGRLDSFCRRRSFELVVGCAAVTIVGGLAGVFAVVFG